MHDDAVPPPSINNNNTAIREMVDLGVGVWWRRQVVVIYDQVPNQVFLARSNGVAGQRLLHVGGSKQEWCFANALRLPSGVANVA